MSQEISICWLRRDLRLEDNAALYHALRNEYPVLILFIFDKNILNKLSDRYDPRVTFIHDTIRQLKDELEKNGSSMLVLYDTPEQAWSAVVRKYNIKAVYTNHDYEPYARERDDALAEFLRSEDIIFKTFKDQTIFDRDELLKSDGKPYTVFTPYYREWQKKLTPFYFRPYPTERYFKNLWKTAPADLPSIEELGFSRSDKALPSREFEHKLQSYEQDRDFPSADATTHIGIHLRFGTVSIRRAAAKALEHGAHKWLSELAWRDFYMMILWHFPHTVSQSFKPAYDQIEWRNNESEFNAWCRGETGFALVDAGMRQLNATGFMHNRLRMLTASFLTKHLLVDWRWGEAYFAEKLLDYEMASNVGGWQWACGCGNDAAPYFRIFNPELQLLKYDPKLEFVSKWIPELKQQMHVTPIVEHAFARERALRTFKKALNTAS
ncbi:cryptochrome/photolyase family protein [Pedobacter deserti]|uniref:cryptochrome/photolyase family protein n=1 Tax=Pedobacter deserti TaxID=2817382 RepID=UPI00210E3D8E|nr:deoxyribodipyrimidine photo-lyase [Pedobacter sp. SYSU D00382]